MQLFFCPYLWSIQKFTFIWIKKQISQERGTVRTHWNANHLPKMKSTKCNINVVNQEFNHLTYAFRGIFTFTRVYISLFDEVSIPILSYFDEWIPDFTIFMYEWVVNNRSYSRLKKVMRNGSVKSREIKSLDWCSFVDPWCSSDDSNSVEFFKIHILFTPLWLVFTSQYLFNPFLMTVSILVNKLERSLVLHLPEPAMKRCENGSLCSLGVQYK